jgi:hypothetical protein
VQQAAQRVMAALKVWLERNMRLVVYGQPVDFAPLVTNNNKKNMRLVMNVAVLEGE